MKSEILIEQARAAILAGDKDAAIEVANNTIIQGLEPADIIDRGLTPGMIRMVERFAGEKTPLPCLLMAAEAMNQALKILEPHVPQRRTGTVIFEKKGIFFARRVLAQMEPLVEALHLMEPTRYTWPSFLWDIPKMVQSAFTKQQVKNP